MPQFPRNYDADWPYFLGNLAKSNLASSPNMQVPIRSELTYFNNTVLSLYHIIMNISNHNPLMMASKLILKLFQIE
jgi:hypothetical protein